MSMDLESISIQNPLDKHKKIEILLLPSQKVHAEWDINLLIDLSDNIAKEIKDLKPFLLRKKGYHPYKGMAYNTIGSSVDKKQLPTINRLLKFSTVEDKFFQGAVLPMSNYNGAIESLWKEQLNNFLQQYPIYSEDFDTYPPLVLLRSKEPLNLAAPQNGKILFDLICFVI